MLEVDPQSIKEFLISSSLPSTAATNLAASLHLSADTQQSAYGATNTVRTIFSTLGKNTHRRPILIVSRMSGTCHNFIFRYPLKKKQHFDVGKASNPARASSLNSSLSSMVECSSP